MTANVLSGWPRQEGVWQRTGVGRPTLLLSDEQFGRLGPAVAEVA